MEKGTHKPSFTVSLLIVAFLFLVIIAQLIAVGEPDIHMSLVFAIAFAAILLIATGTTWDTILEGIMHGCKIAMVSMLILMLIGMLIPALIAAGTIPALINYGLRIINPGMFLFTASLVCSIAAITTGSSYTTGGTFGVAFMGIGAGLGIPAAMTAGAVISGAVIGDKLSPVSDSTNLAAAVTETDLFAHIKSMMFTTIPAFVISLVIYFIIGMRFDATSVDSTVVDTIIATLTGNFEITPVYAILSLLPLIVIVAMAIKKVHALAIMVIAALIAMLIAIFVQGYGLIEMMLFMNYGFTIDTGAELVNTLLNRGGIQSMMWTVSLGFFGLSFGGILEKTYVLDVLLTKIRHLISTARNLIITHVFSTIFVNFISASQYVSIIIPGRMFLPAYKKLRIRSDVASRTSEDAGTVTSPLVPWGLCGVFFAGTLGVPTLEYAPYAFLSFLCPIIAIIYGVTGKFIWMEETREKTAEKVIE